MRLGPIITPFPGGVLSPLMSLLTGASCCRTAGVGSRTPTRGGTPSRPPSTTAGRRRWGRRAGPGRREAGSRDGSRRVGERRTTCSLYHLALFCSGKLRACVRTYERTPRACSVCVVCGYNGGVVCSKGCTVILAQRGRSKVVRLD